MAAPSCFRFLFSRFPFFLSRCPLARYGNNLVISPLIKKFSKSAYRKIT